jgi:hypothetical protein
MAIPLLKLCASYERLYHPFTGQVLDGERPDQLAGVLFVHYGDAGYTYVSPALQQRLAGLGFESDTGAVEAEPTVLAEKLDWPGAFILEIDAGWNGVNSYGLEVV